MRAPAYRSSSEKTERGVIFLPSTHPHPKPAKRISVAGFPVEFGLTFLAGYFPGVLYGRIGGGPIGTQLAEYYTDPLHFYVWSDTFLNQIAAAFLQLLFLTFCAFSVFGAAFLVLFFLAKGAFLGLCAVSTLTLGGGTALVLYWFCVCLPNLLMLFLYLWLSGYAVQLSHHLFQSVFGRGAPRGQLEASRRRFLVRCGVALLISGLFGLLCSGFVSGIVRLTTA